MSIDPIKRLGSADRACGPGSEARPPKPNVRKQAAADSADRIVLSPEAHIRLERHVAQPRALEPVAPGETTQAVVAGSAQESDERAGEIRRRIQQGYYQRQDVVGSIVDALLKSIQEN